MKISYPQSQNNQVRNTESSIELKKGDVLSSAIKERLSNNEAIIQIRGKDVHVKFEGKVPSSDKTTIQIMDFNGQIPQVKAVAGSLKGQNSESDISRVLRSLGASATPELSTAVKSLLDKGVPLSKDSITDLKFFLEKHPGVLNQKLETIKVLANKGLELTSFHLKAVHEALHGKPLSHRIADIAKLLDLDPISRTVNGEAIKQLSSNLHHDLMMAVRDVVKQVKETVQREPNLDKVIQQVREQLINHPMMDREVAAKVEQALSEARQLQQMGREAAARTHVIQALEQAEKEVTQPAKPPQEVVQQVKEAVQREPNLNRAIQQVQEQLVNNPIMDREVAAKVDKALSEARQLQQVGREAAARAHVIRALEQAEMEVSQPPKPPQEVVKQAKEAVQREPNLNRAIQQVREQLVNNPTIDQEVAAKVEKALSEARQLQQVGREATARTHIIQVLEQAEAEMSRVLQPQHEVVQQVKEVFSRAIGKEKATLQVHGNQSSNELKQRENNLVDNINYGNNASRFMQENAPAETVEHYQLNEELLAALKLESIDIVITHITNRMAQAAAQFRDLKREATRNLDSLLRVTESTKTNVYPQLKEILRSTIDIIDKAILKSDFVLFADMATEKQLMSMSMDLATAKKLLAEGRNEQAATLLRKVKTQLVELNWRPADIKVRHILTNEHVLRNTKSAKEQLSHSIDRLVSMEYTDRSARNTYELIRSLGLNYDSEIAQSLVSSTDAANEEQLQRNLKAVMMKLLNTESDIRISPGADQQVKELLQNVTGQQLLSKIETGSPLQTMFFSLPLMLGARMENVKIYVNARKDGQKIDWENCSLYFLINTKKLGETGILLTAANRNLSITLKNDHPAFKEKMENVVEKCKQSLQSIGYTVAALNFTKLSSEKEAPDQNKMAESAAPLIQPKTKGLDFTV